MKNANASVIALLNARPVAFYSCELFAITSVNGPTVYLTNADFDVIGPAPSQFATEATSGFTTVYSSGAYNSGNPKIDLKQSKVTGHWARGLDSDQWQVALLPTTQDPFTGAFTYPDVIGGTPWLAGCIAGLFDGAQFLVARAYFAAPPTPGAMIAYGASARTCVGTIMLFSGTVGVVDANQTVTIFTVNDFKYQLGMNMPRNYLQSSCRHILFDARCTLSAASFAKTAVALAGSTQQLVLATPATPGGSATYQLGRMVGTSGANTGFQRTVSQWDGVKAFQPMYPWPFPVSAGDGFTFYPGCDKSLGAQGCGGFANTPNFLGFPYLPVPEIQIGG